MRVVSPIDNRAEAEALLEAGADELYGGLIPDEWQQRFELVASLNQRTFAEAQIASWGDLAAILELIHATGKTFFLTLNAPFYSEPQLPLLLDYVEQAVQAGIDGIILADLGLLRLLRRRHPGLQYHASTLAHLGNSEAVRFYAEQGISGAVLPRHLSVAELAAIAAAVPEVRCDAFLLVGKCPNTEGLCTFHHSSPDRIWPCEIPYHISPVMEPASAVLTRAMARQHSWSLTNRRHGCGLCAIPGLVAARIAGLKLVGRGAPTAQKVKNILLTRDFLRLAEETSDPADYRKLARAAHHRRFGSQCSPNVCYYPEFYQSE